MPGKKLWLRYVRQWYEVEQDQTKTNPADNEKSTQCDSKNTKPAVAPLPANLIISMMMMVLALFAPVQATATADYLPEPKYTDYAKVSRWALARCNFGTISTLSTRNVGFPFGNVASVADGIRSDIDGKNSTGHPYFYLTMRDISAQDIAANPKVSFQITQATFPGENYCSTLTAEDPTCVRLTLSGNMVTVTNKTEVEFGLDALYSKHPAMEGWPTDHDWKVMKLNITDIFLLDL